MPSDTVDIVMRLRKAAQFQKDAAANAKSIDKTEAAIRKQDRAMDRSNKTGGRFGKTMRGLRGPIGLLGGALGGLAVGAKIKSAVDQTTALAKATLGLSTNFGMSIEQGSAWAAVAQSRGMDPSMLHMGFTKLSRSVVDAVNGSKKAQMTFKRLGITQKDLVAGSHDFEGLLGKVSKGFTDYEGGTWRATDAQRVFGKGAKGLIPILKAGKGGLKDQLAMAKKYGATFGGKTIKDMKDFIGAQRESQMASMGLNVTLATTLIPTLTWLKKTLASTLGKFNELPAPVQTGIIVVIGLTGAMIALSAATMMLGPGLAVVGGMLTWIGGLMIGTRIGLAALAVQQRITAATTWLTSSAFWGLAAALWANPLTWVVAAVLAAWVAFGLLYWKVKAFRNFVNKYWPVLLLLLTGGLVPGILLAIKHFDKLKSAGKSIYNALKSAFNGIKNAFRGAINWIITKWNSFELSIGPVKIPGLPDVPKVSVGTPNIPLLAEGGIVRGAGSWITGEAGPELNTMMVGGGVRVQPLSDNAIGAGDSEIEIHVHTHIDGREVAVTTAKVTGDEAARRGR